MTLDPVSDWYRVYVQGLFPPLADFHGFAPTMMTALRLSGLCLVPLYSLVDGIEPLRHAERRSIEVPATATRRASSVSLGLEGGAEELGALSASHMDGFKVVPHHRLVLENDILGGERIVGGSPADLHEYGFFVQGSGCGASLVAPVRPSRSF